MAKPKSVAASVFVYSLCLSLTGLSLPLFLSVARPEILEEKASIYSQITQITEFSALLILHCMGFFLQCLIK